MSTAAADLERDLLATIPLARAMALRVVAHEGDWLELAAPLAPNINDKGCAFGGSLASLMTLAGWGVLHLAAAAHGLNCDIYVQDSTIRYLAPVWGELRCRAQPAAGESCADMLSALAARGKARLRMECAVALPDGGVAATLSARFVALRNAAAA
ncbi:MAG: YiiD C-terminal domain-containing protein [Dokdonella sp.]|uniref:YiiD C-terminal domain-containing protein n=1 Tax=Dokdonella sp. TaxID=2291710 RepID=UPI0025C30250|nr:YiiD C-terminal domain-containing protein [Dokdonella sp.]MBX3702106.1 YiiD C-terminal domain-containing protein [Dokdonella sp.]